MNIDSFFNSFFVMVLQGARTVYSTLQNITFRDTSLLQYCITLLLLSVVIPMVLTLVSSSVNRGTDGFKSAYREATYTKRYERKLKRDEIHEKKQARAKVNRASRLR